MAQCFVICLRHRHRQRHRHARAYFTHMVCIMLSLNLQLPMHCCCHQNSQRLVSQPSKINTSILYMFSCYIYSFFRPSVRSFGMEIRLQFYLYLFRHHSTQCAYLTYINLLFHLFFPLKSIHLFWYFWKIHNSIVKKFRIEINNYMGKKTLRWFFHRIDCAATIKRNEKTTV